MTTLRQAAQALIERWDAPAWKDEPATAVYIAALRKALEAPLLHTFLDEAKKAGITHLVQPKEAMQMALDALQSCAENTENPMETRDALNALRAALEAPEQVRNQQAEITRLQYEVDAIPAIKAERDALMLANRDLIDWFDAIKSDYDALLAAGKLALEALLRSTEAFAPQREAAITALKSAGAST